MADTALSRDRLTPSIDRVVRFINGLSPLSRPLLKKPPVEMPNLDLAVQNWTEVGGALFFNLEVPEHPPEYDRYFRGRDFKFGDYFKKLHFDLKSPYARGFYDGLAAGESARFVGKLEIDVDTVRIGELTGVLSVGDRRYSVHYIKPRIMPGGGTIRPEPRSV